MTLAIESKHDKTKSTTDSPTAPDQSKEKKVPAPLLIDESKQYFGKKKQPQRPIENVCYTCRHRNIGTKEGDCVYAGLCSYGTTADEDLPPF